MDSKPRVRTEYVKPPIPTPQFDWKAWYDGEEEEQMACGWGHSEAAAIVDLLENFPRS